MYGREHVRHGSSGTYRKLSSRVDADAGFMSLADVAETLGLERSSASRRVGQAIKLGYLMNMETSQGKPMQLYIGDPMPEEVQVLPTVEELTAKVTSETD